MVQHPDFLARLFDTTVFVDTDPTICFNRRLERDIRERGRTREDVEAQYEQDVKPMYEQFVAPCINRANIIIENSDELSATPNEVHFDIEPLITHLNNKSEIKGQTRLKLLSTSLNVIPQATTYSTVVQPAL